MEWIALDLLYCLISNKLCNEKMAFLELTISPCMDVDTNNHGH